MESPPAVDIGNVDSPIGAELSNFSPHRFVVRGEVCESMEGLLQSLKFADPTMARSVRALAGRKAKFKGKKSRWWRTQTLFWNGEPFNRHDSDFQALLDEAFDAMFTQCDAARWALRATGSAELTHSVGRADPTLTVLTVEEFISRLQRIRDELS